MVDIDTKLLVFDGIIARKKHVSKNESILVSFIKMLVYLLIKLAYFLYLLNAVLFDHRQRGIVQSQNDFIIDLSLDQISPSLLKVSLYCVPPNSRYLRFL
jgi:hypothetical protein